MRAVIVAMAGLLGIGLIFDSALAQSARPAYAAGQIWQYHARPSDPASLLKIQVVESDPVLTKSGPIYHVSIVGVHLGSDHRLSEIAHVPVSKDTLDKSVTVLVKSDATFPDVRPGIADWKSAKGGVFTISVAEIVDIIDKMAQGRAGG